MAAPATATEGVIGAVDISDSLDAVTGSPTMSLASWISGTPESAAIFANWRAASAAGQLRRSMSTPREIDHGPLGRLRLQLVKFGPLPGYKLGQPRDIRVTVGRHDP